MSEQEMIPAVDQTETEALQRRLGRLQWLLWLSGGLALIAVLLATFLLLRLAAVDDRLAGIARQLETQNQGLGSLEQGMAQRFEERDQQAAVLADRVESLGGRLTRLDINDPDNAIVALQRILIRSERDYRDFLNDLEQGMNALHRMTPHSRGWWEDFSSNIGDSRRLSEARENYIFNIGDL